MTFEECSTASCCACREFPVCCCPALSGWQRVRPALKARDEAWPAALSTPPTLPARCTPPSAATSASSFQPAALLADGSCSKLLLDPQAVATAAPVAAAVGREILDAACRPCRHWQPAKSTAPTVVFQPMRGEICRAILQWSPVCLQGKLPLAAVQLRGVGSHRSSVPACTPVRSRSPT